RRQMPPRFFGWFFLCQEWVKIIIEKDQDKAYKEMQRVAGKVKYEPDKFEAIQMYGVTTDGTIIMAMQPHDQTRVLEKSFDIHRRDAYGRYSNVNLTTTRMYEAITKANEAIQKIGAGK
ncbi:hypothetical protein ACFV42_49160, partial [Streptomyces solisilvae]|uniref:hypothetical protein n=1 Tax=Streptomyces malaysiensis TaxID=92644 RepID=UPI0036945812